MRSLRSPIRALALALASLGLAAVAGANPAAPVKVAAVKDLPEAVQKTVLAESAGGKIKAMWKETDADGKLIYEVEMLVKGMSKDINVGEDGAVLVCEQQVTLASLPAVVREAMLKVAGKRKIAMAETVTKSGTLAHYEMRIRDGKELLEFEFGLDGKRIQ